MNHFLSQRSWILYLSTLTVLHAMVSQARGEELSLSEDAILRWKEFEQFSRSLQGTARIQSVFSNGKKRIQTYHWKQNHESALGCQISTDFPFESITLENPTYRAELRRDLSNPSRVALSSVEPLHREDDSPQRIGKFSLYSSVGAHFAYWNVPLTELLSRPSFQIKEISKTVEEGKELIRINHTSSMEDLEHKTLFQRQGMIYLDPSRRWCIRRIRETERIYNNGVLHRTAEWDIRYETTDHPSGFPLLQKETTKYEGIYERDKRKAGGTINSEYEWEVNDHIPTSEFTLSAFGLPEPAFAKQTTRRYLWVALGGFICLSLGVFFRWMARRARSGFEHSQPKRLR